MYYEEKWTLQNEQNYICFDANNVPITTCHMCYNSRCYAIYKPGDYHLTYTTHNVSDDRIFEVSVIMRLPKCCYCVTNFIFCTVHLDIFASDLILQVHKYSNFQVHIYTWQASRSDVHLQNNLSHNMQAIYYNMDRQCNILWCLIKLLLL